MLLGERVGGEFRLAMMEIRKENVRVFKIVLDNIAGVMF